MTENKQYLKDELEKFNKIISRRIKKEFQLKPNKVMLEHLLFAEKKIEEAKVFHASQYERRIKTLEDDELTREIPSFTLNKQNKEEHYKREFNREMTYSMDTWFDYIDSFKVSLEQVK